MGLENLEIGGRVWLKEVGRARNPGESLGWSGGSAEVRGRGQSPSE